MDIQDLNNLSNDIAIARIELDALKTKREELIAAIPELPKLDASIAEAEVNKSDLTAKLLQAMRAESLKQWKTENATFSRALRESVSINPAFEKQLKTRLKCGEQIEYLELRSTEYISIRSNPK